MKNISYLLYFIFLSAMSCWSAVAAMVGVSFLFSIIIASGFFTPFFIRKEKAVQMIAPLIGFSFFYDVLSVCLVGIMNLKAGAPFFITGEGMLVFLFFAWSFIGGLAGIVAKGMYDKLREP